MSTAREKELLRRARRKACEEGRVRNKAGGTPPARTTAATATKKK